MTAFDHRRSLTAVVGAAFVFGIVTTIGGVTYTLEGLGLEAAGAVLIVAASWPRRYGRLGFLCVPLEYWGTLLVVAGIVALTVDL